jgi:hypothetical protein
MLNLNGSLTKAGVRYATLWSEDFTDAWFREKLGEWLATGRVTHDASHVRPFSAAETPADLAAVAGAIAADLRRRQSIMGVFDEGCMGMYNAIIPDEILHSTGVFKERLSQSALYAEMLQVPNEEAQAVRSWLDLKGMRFVTGEDPDLDLTRCTSPRCASPTGSAAT